MHLAGPIINGIGGFGTVFVLASAFYVGTEIISLAAGETIDPIRAIPRVRWHREGPNLRNALTGL